MEGFQRNYELQLNAMIKEKMIEIEQRIEHSVAKEELEGLTTRIVYRNDLNTVSQRLTLMEATLNKEVIG